MMIKLLYELLYVLAIATGLLSVLSVPMELGEAGWILFLIELTAAALIVIIKNSALSGKIISVGVLSSFTVFILIFSRYQSFIGKDANELKYLWLLVFAVLAFVFGELVAYLRTFGNIVTWLSFASLIPLMIFKVEIGKPFVAAVFLLVILSVCREIQIRWKKEGNTDVKTHLVTISPFILAVIILLLLCPAPKERYNWTFVKTVYKTVNQAIQEIRIKASIREEDYVDTMMGFSDEGNLEGKVKDNSERVLAIYEIPKDTTQLRLIGKNFSTFTGRNWIDDDTDTAPDSMFDMLGMISSINDYTDEPEKIVRWQNMYIKYIQMNTNYVFAPGKSAVRKSHFEIFNSKIKNRGSDIMWPEMQSFQTAYTINYLLLNTESDAFADYINSCTIPSEESYNENLKKANLEKENEYSYENYLSHRDYIKEEYCKEVVLSDSLRAYMDELLKDCGSDYEKLLRIQQLLQTFEYTTAPGELPEEIDSDTEFLDYFILEKREGYCSFYATAFVLLARAEGIPARYVQGYCAPTYSLSSIYITSAMAHAWCEVYFDGAGWIPFDGTPGYGGSTYWDPDNVTVSVNGYDLNEKTKYVYTSDPLPELPEDSEEETEENQLKWYIVAIPVATGLLIITFFFAVFKLNALIRFKKMKYDKQFVVLSRQIFLILKLLGRPIEEGETINEYYRRLSKEYSLSKLSFLNDLEEYLYNNRDSSESLKSVCANAESIRSEFLVELRHQSFIKYLRYRLRW